MIYHNASKGELDLELSKLRKEYEEKKELNLSLNMARGKPEKKQSALSEGLLTVISENADCFSEDGSDCRNYGGFDGLPEMKKLFSDLFEIPSDNIFVGGPSSLNLMYDTVVRHLLFGAYEGSTPWIQQGKIKFLCPAPGYDRHFGITERLGIEMITVPMTEAGPDIDMVEELVKRDPQIKGIWCVPKYSNPTGVTYCGDIVRRLASLKTAADDFRIFWDNAYALHDLYDEGDVLLNIFDEAKKAGNPDIVYIFSSFAKITYAGGGVSMFATSDKNMAYAKKLIASQTICFDKMNQLRHVKYFKNAEGVRKQMKKHAAILRPKFERVLEIFERELAPVGIGNWVKPRGGYFISLDLPEGTAKRTYNLCKDLGVTLTKVGATFPYGIDPKDQNLRIAPSFPSLEDLTKAAEVLCLCAKIASAEKYLKK